MKVKSKKKEEMMKLRINNDVLDLDDYKNYNDTITYMRESDSFIAMLYVIFKSFPESFNENHKRFLKADGYEYDIEKYLPFERVFGEAFDVISKINKDRVSIKSQKKIFQEPETKSQSYKKDKNGEILYSTPKNIVVSNSLSNKKSEEKNIGKFEYLLSIQIDPFAIAVADYNSIINNGKWQGDQFVVRMYNHEMKKTNDSRQPMISVPDVNRYLFYKKLDPKYYINNFKEADRELNKHLKNLFDSLIFNLPVEIK